MFLKLKNENMTEKDKLYSELVEECYHSPPGARLTYNLRNKLEKLPIKDRSEIVSRPNGGSAPLFAVCRRGQTDIVEYLITHCNADIEQWGLFEVLDDRSTHMVTPLWCASVSGKLEVVKILLKYGANVNAVSDTGSTPVRSACFMTHLDVVQYLVEHGANINQQNYNGGTCLINSVQSSSLCEFLLKSGADVNARDIQNKTALHYAIQEHRLETTELLLNNGADVHAKSRYGDDALQMACLKGAVKIFEYLITNFTYSVEKLANAHELMGATFSDEHNDSSKALHYWREGLFIRYKNNLFPKQPIMTPIENYKYQKEFESMEDIDNISIDIDLIRIQSLLIAERILGTNHKEMIFRLMYRGASFADMMRYQSCIHLWMRALEIRVKKDTILYTDTCFTAQALVRLMLDHYEKSKPIDEVDANQRFRDVHHTFLLLTKDLVEIRKLLTIRPVYKRQTDFFDKILKCVTHLIYLLIVNSTSVIDQSVTFKSILTLVRNDPKTILYEDSLLHLCVSKNNIIRSSYFVEEEPMVIFPNYAVLKLLLSCGAAVNARNNSGSTPLHIATSQIQFDHVLINLLLDYGAHIDQPNSAGITPMTSIIAKNKVQGRQIEIMKNINLKCFCATILCRYNIPYKNMIPRTLENFVQLHEPKKS